MVSETLTRLEGEGPRRAQRAAIKRAAGGRIAKPEIDIVGLPETHAAGKFVSEVLPRERHHPFARLVLELDTRAHEGVLRLGHHRIIISRRGENGVRDVGDIGTDSHRPLFRQVALIADIAVELKLRGERHPGAGQILSPALSGKTRGAFEGRVFGVEEGP